MSNPIKWLDRDDGPVNYGEPTYWERRYELDRKEFGTGYRHDWYFDFDRLKATFESYFGQPQGQRILVVGCGLSTIASQMHAAGYRCITALDISATAISLMQEGERHKEGVEYFIGDARKMDSLPDNLFDCIFDKGCADSLLCGYRSTADVVDMFRECCRVLRPEGVFLCISHGPPDARMHMFRHEGLQWATNVIPMHGTEGLNAYVSTKWSREEIEGAERRQLDDIQSTLSTQTGSTFSRSTRTQRRGMMNENRIIYSMAPHEIDKIEKKQGNEAAERKRAQDAAWTAAKTAVRTAAGGRALAASSVGPGELPPTTAVALTGSTGSPAHRADASVQSLEEAGDEEGQKSFSRVGGGVSMLNPGSVPSMVGSSVTTSAADLPSDVFASG